ncbi:MAG: HAD family hydrolase [Planctomycetota bacterium]|nr:HAD family hydrolase [Planctomycetota bacterium]
MLILFDIDGTLLLTQKAGIKAMQSAAKELFGDHVTFEGVDFAGRLDPQIWAAAAQRNKIDPSEHDRFRDGYLKHLRQFFEATPTSVLLPGVRELVEALQAREDVTLGLLTGNYPETGRLKIEQAGLDPELFPVAAWGDDGQQRTDLPLVGMRQYAELKGEPIPADRVIIIGDTIHDVECAKVNGCRSLAVATGPAYSVDDLMVTEPDLLVKDLSETDRILEWMLNVKVPVSE